jgi:hypothetical protein
VDVSDLDTTDLDSTLADTDTEYQYMESEPGATSSDTDGEPVPKKGKPAAEVEVTEFNPDRIQGKETITRSFMAMHGLTWDQALASPDYEPYRSTVYSAHPDAENSVMGLRRALFGKIRKDWDSGIWYWKT